MLRILILLSALWASCAPAVAAQRHVLIVNDDGLTSNVLALYRALKARGDDVIVSVPCHNQSGQGTALRLEPPAPLDRDCRAGAAKAGAPAAGPMTRTGLPPADFHYIDGTPTMALLYGVDMLAAARWHGGPDLVLSGPNEGRNAGPSILASGTVSAVRFALVRGIPAIALSAGAQTGDDRDLANPASARIADRAVGLIAALDRLAGEARLIPAGLALNVNFPDAPDAARWRAARIGTYDAYAVTMVPDAAGARLSLGANPHPPTAAQAGDEAALVRDAITISPIRDDNATPTPGSAAAWLKRLLRSEKLLDPVDH
ncbi:5'/3'-nucleotidase SurE [Novosphingobium colocasiae]|uniref:5'-nucleotidase n=1 Tax=Novosphingobium colocasiae TaxID=1256513 RepID=A0A918PCF5_9SPHN|nr:5'/3'-nucleotidase SurE [Novosphingobium colocasiae]GGY99106.1 acid phosphatase [Novosphingobium colocasiae]